MALRLLRSRGTKGSETSESLIYDKDEESLRLSIAESLIYDKDEESLRLSIAESFIVNEDKESVLLSIQGFNLSGSGLICWEDVVIHRAGHRKVKIQLLDTKYNPSDRGKRRSYVFQSSLHDFNANYIGLSLILTTWYLFRNI